MSLIIGDLLFSGVAFPLIIAVETLNSASPSIWKQGLYTGIRCFIFFCCILNAVSNALLTFDRFDLTQRPSNRFFRRKRTFFFIVMGWIIATLSLLSPLLSAVLQSKNVLNQAFTIPYQNSSWLKATGLDQTLVGNSSSEQQSEITCFGSCFTAHVCFVYPTSTSQVSLQFIFYIFASVTMFSIYGYIHYSLYQRACRYV